jgi:hypothetical protein
VYIPGESPIILENSKYLDTVSKILQYVSTNNKKETYPLMAVSYGYLAMIKILQISSSLEAVPSELIRTPVQVNLRMAAEKTFIYDDYSNRTADLDK